MLLHLFLACQTPQPESVTPGVFPAGGEILVTIDGKNHITDKVLYSSMGIPASELEKLKENPQFQQALAQEKDKQILFDLIYREALKANVHTTESTKENIQIARALAEREALVMAYMDDWSRKQVTDEKINQWYEDHKVGQFEKNEVDISVIQLASQEEANAALAQLKAGEDFAKVADEKNTHPQLKGKGGAAGSFNLNDRAFSYGPAVQKALLTTEAGSYTDVLPVMSRNPSQSGFVIVKLNSSNKSYQPLEEVKELIEVRVMQEAQQTLITDLKSKADISYPDQETKPQAEITTETK